MGKDAACSGHEQYFKVKSYIMCPEAMNKERVAVVFI